MIYLVRRAATSNDEAVTPVLLGRKRAMQLSTDGKLRASALASLFANRRIAAVYSSPLARAVQTAGIIAEACSADLTFCTSLTDADVGDWESLTFAQIMNDSRFSDYIRNPAEFQYPGGESIADMRHRAVTFVAQLAKRYAGQNIVVVTHRPISRVVIANLSQLCLGRAKEIDQDPGCINLIRVYRGEMALQAINNTAIIDSADMAEESVLCAVE